MVSSVLMALVMAVAMGPEEDRLAEAIRRGDAAAVKVALDAGADAYWEDRDGVSLVHLASLFAEGPVIQNMIAGGVDFNRVDYFGWSALDLMLWKDQVDAGAVMALIEARVDSRRDPNGSPLASIAAATNEDLTRRLIAAGFAIDGNHGGWRPLSYAVVYGSAGSVKALIEAGALDGDGDEFGRSMLHQAAVRMDAEGGPVVAALVAAGIDPDVLDDQGFSPLGMSALSDCKLVAAALLDAGADVNLANWRGETALTLAAGYGSSDLVELLIARGADVNAANDTGGTALIAALTTGDPAQLLQRLHDWGWATLTMEEAIARVERRNVEGVIRALLEAGADPNAHGTRHWSPLAYAAHLWNFKNLRRSAADAHGDDPLALERDGLEGLDPTVSGLWEKFAEAHDPVIIARLLIEKGAKRFTNAGADPLNVAAQRMDARRMPLIEVLRSAETAEGRQTPPRRRRF